MIHSKPFPMPMLSLKGVLVAMATAVLLGWPMLLVTAPTGYLDTPGYYTGGQSIFYRIENILDIAERSVPSSADTIPVQSDARIVRSIVYSAYLFFSSQTPLGLVLSVQLQTALVLLLVLPFVPETKQRGRLLAGGLFVGAFTTLPWFASYAMPDFLGGAIILFSMLLVGPIDRVSTLWKVIFATIAAFAVMSHYGNIVLAAVLLLVVVVLRVLRHRSRPSILWFAALPVIGAIAINLGVSGALMGGASMVPKRLPLVLARSIADGPGAAYLDDVCQTQKPAPWAICDVMPDRPRDLGGLLWSDRGFTRLSSADLDAVRHEEVQLLWQIFRNQPLAQGRALLGNAFLQTILIGTGEIRPLQISRIMNNGLQVNVLDPSIAQERLLSAFDYIVKIGTAVGAIFLVGALIRGRRGGPGTRLQRDMALVCLIGLVGNAFIFGGLSAPVDRYQSRLVWIVPVLGVLFWLDRRPERFLPKRIMIQETAYATHV